ncbi:MAG: NarK family nitrate/nitrite MFS transporter [Acidimicrobiales bacterium]
MTTTPASSMTRADGSEGIGRRLRRLWSFDGPYRVLHLTWFAFFLSFVVWFNFAPFSKTIGQQLHLSKAQLVTLGLCNVALTVPGRVFVGMALDRFGPRRTYGAILIYAVVPCTMFATARSFEMMVISRLLLGLVGAGFVVGIRMVSEWFAPADLGTAEGVYGGWGNFGASAAAFGLPALATWIASATGSPDGWRWAIGLTGLMAAAYGVVYLRAVEDTPEGVAYVRSRKAAGLEVTNRKAVFGLAALTVPVWGILGVIAWRVWDVKVISTSGLVAASLMIAALLVWQLATVFRVNSRALHDEYPPADAYPMRSVAVLAFAYFCTFGSELAVVSMLPTFFSDTWSLSAGAAGLAASSFAFMNLVTRPGGGLLSDVLGSRKRTLTALLAGLAVGNVAMAMLGSAWPLLAAIGVSMCCSVFGQAGNGATYAVVPLVKKRVSGQISGLVGAYGNIGGIVFLTAFLFVTPRVFFLVIAAAAVVATLVSRWLVEPANSFSTELVTEVASAAVEPTRVTVPGAVGAPAMSGVSPAPAAGA